ncbi:hypothetical protein [Streptomyces sp. NPDC056154]|uniref:hypothetical protein n=1 Tax=unclassified Streptomyces TaxID=2593676 RepID=UPI0035DF5399
MAEMALNARDALLGVRAPWTVAQGASSRNLVILLGLIASCVINGDTLTDVLRQATWLTGAVVILIIARTTEVLLLRPDGVQRPQ